MRFRQAGPDSPFNYRILLPSMGKFPEQVYDASLRKIRRRRAWIVNFWPWAGGHVSLGDMNQYPLFVIQSVSRILVALSLVLPVSLSAGEVITGLEGDWVINEELSEDTDEAVEDAIRAAGGKPDSGGRKGKGRYRGGPEEHELYDRASYDNVLSIGIDSPEITFTYADGYRRTFYTDGRGRSVSAKGMSTDYSFADWGEEKLFVESVPRDGGRTREVYSLMANGNQLRAELELKPLGFSVPVKIVRIYNRKGYTPDSK